MNHLMYKFIVSVFLSLAMLGCSGGGGGDGAGDIIDPGTGTGGTPVVDPVISGTVATGGAFVGAVNAYGSNGGSVMNTPIDASGNYSVTVGELTPPYLLCATPDNPVLATLCSWASEAGITNITQMTTLALYYANNEQDPASLVNSWPASYQTVSGNLPNAQAVVNANFISIFYAVDLALNIDFSTYDFFTSRFSIGDTYDQILALLDVDLSSNPPIISVNNAPFVFDPNIDISGINIGATPGGGLIGLGGLTISGLDTPVIGTSFIPEISGVSVIPGKVAAIWQNLDATGLLSVQSDKGQIAYLIYVYGDIVQGSVAIPVESYVNLIACTGVVSDDCNNVILDTDKKTLTLNNVQLNVPLEVGITNLATGSITMNGVLSWE
jgi:hypothetical protein